MCKNFFYLHNHQPMVVVGQKTKEGSWYLPQLDISEHESNLFEDAFDFYHSRLAKIASPGGAKPTRVSYLWLINGEKS